MGANAFNLGQLILVTKVTDFLPIVDKSLGSTFADTHQALSQFSGRCGVELYRLLCIDLGGVHTVP